ncbi:T9SS type A sorting domain-containing protein [Flavobacteriaceae bacterium]|nr:T9SS type A sorting domain-containing protein [Flavobacteriaceae bacterium]
MIKFISMKKKFVLVFVLFLNTMLCFSQTSPISNGNWQDPTIWPGAQIPGNSDDIVIPSGRTISLTGTIAVKSITINGTLQAISGADIQVTTEWIMVMGNTALFEIGTAANPFDAAYNCTITLTGLDDGDDIMGMGDKFIGAMGGGNIEFHGKQKMSWTHLGTTVLPGSNQITMATPVDWATGDEIVLVASFTDWEEAEKKTITAISANGLNITLNSNLSYPHSGIVETYTRSTDNKTWTADLRAEVGLLTHNIKIQGDASSESNGFGGHIMAMPNSIINASSIELYRMGQKAKLGRYPWHWHLLDDFGTGQYFINSSVHHSFNRAITIHGTSYVNVENNFFYDHIGHGVFLEDGSERFNTIRDNVTLLSKRPLAGEEVTPSDNEMNEVQNRTPASFWITNPNNIFEGNVAAGTQGTGFWFSLPQSPMGASAGDPRYAGIEPYKEPLGSFKNNKAHSCMSGFDIFDQLNPDHSIKRNAGWQNSDEHLIEDCTWYANDLALYTGIGGGVGDKIIYTGNLIFKNNVIIDNVTNMMFASYSQVQESVFVASGRIEGSSLYRIYDGAGLVRDCHLVGWDTSMDYLKDGGAATKHTNHRISGITTDDGELPVVKLRDYDIPISNTNFTPQSLSHPRVWNIVLYDEDGSFSGAPNSSIVSNHPMMLVGDEFQPSNWVNAYRSPHKFAHSYLTFPGLATDDYPNLTCTRSKTGTPTESVYYMYGYQEKIQLPFIVSEDFIYNYQFESLPSTKSIDVFMDDAEAGDSYLLRFQDFGKLGGLNFNVPLPEYTSMNDLTNSNQGGFLTEPNGNLYVKLVAIQHLQSFNISWSTDFNVPILDTDQDGVSDRQEIITGTDPFDQVLSVQELNTVNLVLFPNPIRKGDKVNISIPVEFQNIETSVSLISVSGKTLANYQFLSNENISFSTDVISRGVYFVRIESKQWRSDSKLIIK